ncbi:MAG TPA: hypothetical protein GX717_09630 [Clostridiaceae bacterium]|nr:hypothetical protein [Clostridiaceae bacterium]
MKALLHNIRLVLVIFVLIFIGLIAGVVVQEHRSSTQLLAAAGENKQALASRYSQAGSIYSIDGYTLAHSEGGDRLYAEDAGVAASCLQIVGDYTHNIANTIESEYQGFLLGTGRPLMTQIQLDLSGKGLDGDDITLTLNAELNQLAWELLGDQRGAVVLLDYTTGDILASVSTPTTLPDNVISYTDIPDSALYNRAFLGTYAPGSSFKFITAAAWFTSPEYDPDFTVECLGSTPLIEPDGVKEANDSTHGTLGLQEALNVSCNFFFGEVGVRVGDRHLRETIREFGIGNPIAVDRLSVTQAAFRLPDRDSTRSWISIGQPVADSELAISPLQMAMTVGAVANNGTVMAPHLINHMTTPLDTIYQERQVRALWQACDEVTAAQVKAWLIGSVAEGTGSGAQVEGYTIGGKTGTTEVEGQEKDNALFLGFIDDPDHPYAIAVVCEDAGFGAANSAPIASRMFQRAIEIDLR